MSKVKHWQEDCRFRRAETSFLDLTTYTDARHLATALCNYSFSVRLALEVRERMKGKEPAEASGRHWVPTHFFMTRITFSFTGLFRIDASSNLSHVHSTRRTSQA